MLFALASCGEAALFFGLGLMLIFWRLGQMSNTENGEQIKSAATNGIIRAITRWFK